MTLHPKHARISVSRNNVLFADKVSYVANEVRFTHPVDEHIPAEILGRASRVLYSILLGEGLDVCEDPIRYLEDVCDFHGINIAIGFDVDGVDYFIYLLAREDSNESKILCRKEVGDELEDCDLNPLLADYAEEQMRVLQTIV